MNSELDSSFGPDEEIENLKEFYKQYEVIDVTVST